MSKSIIMSILFIIFSFSFAVAQNIDTVWTKTYWEGEGYFDSVNCLQETSDSGFIMAGYSHHWIDGGDNIKVVKTDSLGNFEWSSIIGTDTSIECAYHILQTFDGGYLVSAASDLFGEAIGDNRIWILKLNSVGDTIWTFPYTAFVYNGYPLYATQTHDSGFAITGIYNFNYDNKAFIMRLNKDGDLQWCSPYDGVDWYQAGLHISELPQDSGFMVAGMNDFTYSSGYDFWAFRTDRNGSVQWDSSYALTDYYDEMHAACLTDDGFVMTGLARAEGWIHKIDFDGNTIWSKSISKYFTNERNNSIIQTPDGGYMVGGWVGVAGHRRDHCFIKTNEIGDTLWSFTVGGTEDDHGRSLVMTSDNAYAMVGSNSSFQNGTSFYLTKIHDIADCADITNNGVGNLLDITYYIRWLYRGGPPPLCPGPEYSCADLNGDCIGNLLDITYYLNWLYRGGPAPLCNCSE